MLSVPIGSKSQSQADENIEQDEAGGILQNNDYDFVYCWIEGVSIIDPASEFCFRCNLRLRSHPSREESIPFNAPYNVVKRLLSHICNEKIYSATNTFPPCM